MAVDDDVEKKDPNKYRLTILAGTCVFALTNSNPTTDQIIQAAQKANTQFKHIPREDLVVKYRNILIKGYVRSIGVPHLGRIEVCIQRQPKDEFELEDA